MKSWVLPVGMLFLISSALIAQSGWTIATAPDFKNRVDDVFMVNAQTGYAVSGDGYIVKTTDGGDNWSTLMHDTSVYCRSVEFINEKKGFAGGFPRTVTTKNILRKTTDGGATWTDLTSLLHPKAYKGICGLSAPDSLTVYGCGNWYQDSAYIIKSTDGGNTWSFMDMGMYASSLIDMHFINKDTGFVTGRGILPSKKAVIVYTTDGGQTWAYKYQHDVPSTYVWKIQSLTDKIYFASVENFTPSVPVILRSVDGGMTWSAHAVYDKSYNLQGIGFINPAKGWTGGGFSHSFESTDGGLTWDTVRNVCPLMNRVFRVNDTLLFATGDKIWKYHHLPTEIIPESGHEQIKNYVSLTCNPNPVDGILTVDIVLSFSTQVLLVMLNEQGEQVKTVENLYKSQGSCRYQVNATQFPTGVYYLLLKTHEDKAVCKISVVR